MSAFNQDNTNNSSVPAPGDSANIANSDQMQQPNQQAPTPPPQSPSPNGTNAPMPSAGPTPPNQPAKSSKRWIIILIAVLVLAVLGIAVFILLQSNNSNKNAATNSTSSNETASQSTTTDTQAAVPNGWVTKTRKCFSFALPADNDLDDGDNSCLVSVRYGPDKVSGFSITYFLKPSGTAAENVAEWKKQNPTQTVTSESSTTVGGLPATKLVHNPTTGYDTKDKRVTIFVETGDKYKIEGVNVNGFEINSRYDDQYDSKALFDQVLGTWKWL